MTCTNCSQMASQVSVLRGRVNLLRQVLAETIGGIRATAQFIEDQQEQPTMPRRDLPAAIHSRLTFVADTAEGRR